MASLKWIAAAALIIVVIVFSGLSLYLYLAAIDVVPNPNPSSAPSQPAVATPFGGSIPLTLNVPFFMFNGTNVAAASTCPQAILLRADKATIIGQSSSGTAITGNLNPQDNGVAYLLVAPSSTGTYGTLDSLISSSNGGIITQNVGLTLFQGQYFTMFALNLGNLQQISTGVTTTVNLYGYTSETPTLGSLLNTTAIGSGSFGYGTTTNYFSGFAGTYFGQGYKITRMQVVFNTTVTTNTTAYDNGEFTLKSAVINLGNSASISTTNINWGGTGTGIIEIGAPTTPYLCGTVVNQQALALPVLVGQSDSPSGTMTITLSWYGKQTSAGDQLGASSGSNTVMGLKVYYISPTGTTGSVTQPLLIS